MCGIVGYVGQQPAMPLLLNGLKRLEYRGYDSSGIALMESNGSPAESSIIVARSPGAKNIDRLPKLLGSDGHGHTVGVAHTRWATHGVPNAQNAHPHAGCERWKDVLGADSSVGRAKIVVAHNGIIENFADLKETLRRRGHTFFSDTDSEVLAHLFEENLKGNGGNLLEAVRTALPLIEGTYGIVVLSADHPNEIIAAAHGSPMVIGPSGTGTFVASDIIAFMEHTKQRVDLDDGHIARLTRTGFKVVTIGDESVTPTVHAIHETLEAVELGGFRHHMRKEIAEQPAKLRDTSRGRTLADGTVRLGGFGDRESEVVNAEQVIIVACGTSWHAGLIFGEMLAGIAKIRTEVHYASEFADRPIANTPIPPRSVAFAISQSGETQDTIGAVKKLQACVPPVPVFGICNAVGTKIPRLCGAGVYIHVGREIGVASTKAFTGQVLAAALISLYLAEKRGTVDEAWARRFGNGIRDVPDLIERILVDEDRTRTIRSLAERFARGGPRGSLRYAWGTIRQKLFGAPSQNFLYLGRGINFPVALEGALKLKEISYIHAEGYPAAEMKHGPIALIDRRMPVVVIALKSHDGYAKVCSNIQEVKSRGGRIIAVAEDGDEGIAQVAEHVLRVPKTSYWLSPLVTVVSLQLFAYEIARLRGCPIDQPRNLAKSVTVP